MIRISAVEFNPDHIPSFQLPPSKSTYNRHRILYHLAGKTMPYCTGGLPADCRNLDLALKSSDNDVYLGQGGTSLRFYLSSRLLSKNSVRIHVDDQLKSRPLNQLLDALESLGLIIERGWPLLIRTNQILNNKVCFHDLESSQFISSLALVGAFMNEGITIEWSGPLVSKSFLTLTLKILDSWQIRYILKDNELRIFPGFSTPNEIQIEGDWASSSYIIMGAALRQQTVKILNLKFNTDQPDENLRKMLPLLGVSLHPHQNGIQVESIKPEHVLIKKDFSNCPDLAPTLCVWHLMQGIPIWFSGLETLNLKESKRLDKLAELLRDMQLEFTTTQDSIYCPVMNPKFPERYTVHTAEDHRLAMALSDLCLKIPNLNLSEIISVDKSFPRYWDEMSVWKIASR
jgi:3-phosphoshikimate 1-carboxyvinyltransferase